MSRPQSTTGRTNALNPAPPVVGLDRGAMWRLFIGILLLIRYPEDFLHYEPQFRKYPSSAGWMSYPRQLEVGSCSVNALFCLAMLAVKHVSHSPIYDQGANFESVPNRPRWGEVGSWKLPIFWQRRKEDEVGIYRT